MEKIILVVHIIAAAAVIGLILVQHGKGADMGASFGGGGGASGSLFGVSGSSNLLSRLTGLFTAIFFVTSITLAYLASNQGGGSVIKSTTTTEIPSAVGGSVVTDTPAVDVPVAIEPEAPADIPK